jgi:hypothetical protein
MIAAAGFKIAATTLTLWHCDEHFCLAILPAAAPALQHGLAVGAVAVQDDAMPRQHYPVAAAAVAAWCRLSTCCCFWHWV